MEGHGNLLPENQQYPSRAGRTAQRPPCGEPFLIDTIS
jgi:hypothetical protein